MTDALPRVWASEPGSFVADAAATVAREIKHSIAERGHCRVALAGGGTPRPIYEAMARRTDIDWAAVSFIWGDERGVGPDDDSSNYRMACRAWLDHIDVPKQAVVRIEGERPAEAARSVFEQALGETPIDVVLLGMGGDGHTASLFPGDPASDQVGARVVVTQSPVPPTTRISLSMRAINEAHVVLMFVTGQGKAARLAEVWVQLQTTAPLLPAARVRPDSGNLHWLLDRAAAQQLPQDRVQDPRTQL